MTKSVQEIYETENIDVDTLFTVTSAEVLIFLMKSLPISDIDGLNSNFSLQLPFKSLKLSPNSEVSSCD